MKARVSFKSSYFPVEPGEDEDINPGVFGKALAAWVADKLRERGVGVEKIVEEDFGRLVMVQRKPFMLWVGCANAENSTTDWQLFLAAEVGPLRRIFQRVDPTSSFSELMAHVRAIVEQIPGVSAIEWHPQ
jgi:hypothetical protein